MLPLADRDPSLVLHQIADLASGPKPDYDAARKLIADLGAAQPALQAQAEQLLRLYEAAQAPGGWGARLTGFITQLIPGRTGVVVASVAVAAGLLAWYFLSGPANAPSTASVSYPLPIPLFEPGPGGRMVTYQHGGLLECAVQPAPKDIRLDGDLTTWPRKARFRSAWVAPYDGQRYVEGCLLMDDGYLYIGAHVGDPWPLHNAHKPDGDPDNAWAGGALQVRLGTNVADDKDGWPVTPDYPDDKFVHLTLWHSEGRACLHLAEGVRPFRFKKVLFPNDDGYDARIDADKDGHGYVVKCRVPWKVLGLEKAPFGRKLGLCWEVCWSDRAGKDFVGKLTEFFDADVLRQLDDIGSEAFRVPGRQSILRPVIWGKAVCPPAR